MNHVFPQVMFTPKKLKKYKIDLTQSGRDYYTDPSIWNRIVNLQMLDENENKSKGGKTFEEWAKTANVNYKKQLLPKITEFTRFIDFVDQRWIILEKKLKEELQFKDVEKK